MKIEGIAACVLLRITPPPQFQLAVKDTKLPLRSDWWYEDDVGENKNHVDIYEYLFAAR